VGPDVRLPRALAAAGRGLSPRRSAGNRRRAARVADRRSSSGPTTPDRTRARPARCLPPGRSRGRQPWNAPFRPASRLRARGRESLPLPGVSRHPPEDRRALGAPPPAPPAPDGAVSLGEPPLPPPARRCSRVGELLHEVVVDRASAPAEGDALPWTDA